MIEQIWSYSIYEYNHIPMISLSIDADMILFAFTRYFSTFKLLLSIFVVLLVIILVEILDDLNGYFHLFLLCILVTCDMFCFMTKIVELLLFLEFVVIFIEENSYFLVSSFSISYFQLTYLYFTTISIYFWVEEPIP